MKIQLQYIVEMREGVIIWKQEVQKKIIELVTLKFL